MHLAFGQFFLYCHNMIQLLIATFLLALLAAGCSPAAAESPDNMSALESIVQPTAELTNTIPAPQEAMADPTKTFVPVVQADDMATPESPPLPTATVALGGPINAITLEPVLSGGLNRPLYLTHAGDDRLFVVEQPGKIRIIQNGQLQDEPFIDLTDRVGARGGEQGLLSVAFHPQYLQEGSGGFGKFYVDYTDLLGNTQISRFSVDPTNPNAADPSSEVILLSVSQPFLNHNGGLLKFGPDGYLYAGLGDGGYGGDPYSNGQSLNTLLGSLLRLDVSDGGDAYAIPASNPFVNESDRMGEIWAYGLRNPWRFSFDRQTGDLFIADVGQSVWEEVNFQPAESTGGENYGWNILEGSHCFSDNNCRQKALYYLSPNIVMTSGAAPFPAAMSTAARHFQL